MSYVCSHFFLTLCPDSGFLGYCKDVHLSHGYYAKTSYHFAEIISHRFLFRSFSLHGIMMIYLSVQK